jgi:TonB family protein
MMNYRLIGFILLLNFLLTNVSGQRVRKSMDQRFVEHYSVLAADTTQMHGQYMMYYKDLLIEKGSYRYGKRSGKWTFFNLGGDFEFQYDFDSNTLLRIAGSDFYKLRNERPSLFLGSPLVPYVYISSMVGYPLEAIEKGIKGQVVLTLKISDKGEILDRYISHSLNEMMDSAVLKAAMNFPEKWEWIPAKRMGVNVESLYNITVFFDLY